MEAWAEKLAVRGWFDFDPYPCFVLCVWCLVFWVCLDWKAGGGFGELSDIYIYIYIIYT